ncbi:hypothetical protein AB0D66_28260 [Streptomyces sp. NPDC048270]|uniref:hypothetical protein n=1 Tax=Streptomyces sp. NPDC048270 TaxID=3154615 RepID=UPI0033D95A07
MTRTATASALSFDDHVAEALALVADRRSPRTVDRPQSTSARGLARVIPLPPRTAADTGTRR